MGCCRQWLCKLMITVTDLLLHTVLQTAEAWGQQSCCLPCSQVRRDCSKVPELGGHDEALSVCVTTCKQWFQVQRARQRVCVCTLLAHHQVLAGCSPRRCFRLWLRAVSGPWSSQCLTPHPGWSVPLKRLSQQHRVRQDTFDAVDIVGGSPTGQLRHVRLSQ